MANTYLAVIVCIAFIRTHLCEDFCSQEDTSCIASNKHEKYSREFNELSSKITSALEHYVPCKRDNCSCHKSVISFDLAPFKEGITKEQFNVAQSKGTKYQIIQGKLYREKDCHFPARCAGIEHYLTALAPKMPDMELAINNRDWPQLNQAWGQPKAPVLSFSKTRDYYDIMYPAWSFWEGGPAISLYPTGIGRWDKHRISISAAATKKTYNYVKGSSSSALLIPLLGIGLCPAVGCKRWPWEKKQSKAFFRGSRTSEERDPLIYLSRSEPGLVDAQYTKNQAWKSDADTLYAPPASEVSFEDHCQYKYLFNYRGVAASFRFKHLFLCKSLVFHVGDAWLEFYYPSLKPWVHYVPISPTATKEEIKKYIEYFKGHDSIAKEISERGYDHIWDNLTDKDVKCYWRKLLKSYAKLVKYEVVKDRDLISIK